MGASESSETINQTQQSIINQVQSTAGATLNQQCEITGVMFMASGCYPKIQNQCAQNANLQSSDVVTAQTSAVQNASTNQSEQGGMIPFLGFSSSSTDNDINQTLTQQTDNSCNIVNQQNLVIQDLKIFLQGRCIREPKIVNTGNQNADCALYTTSSLCTDADATSNTSQQTGRHHGDGGCASFLVIAAVLVFMLIVLLLTFKTVHKFIEKNKEQKKKDKEKMFDFL